MSNNWHAGAAVSSALHPSTSKEYVLPRYDLALFASDHFSVEDGGESVLNNFLKLEKHHLPKSNYFQTVQTEVTLPMRSETARWMLEVCEEEQCSCEVFPMAVSFVDRFLSVESIHKGQLQALATACLFLASKQKLPRHFDGLRLSQYTDESVSVSEILSWEMLVLNRLNWELASLTAHDFLDQYLHRLKLPHDQVPVLRMSLNFLVAQAAIDFRIAVLPPSMIAAICLHVASAQVFGELHVSYQKIGLALEKMMDIVMDPTKPYAAAIYDLGQQHEIAFVQPSVTVLRPLQLPSFSTTFTQLVKNNQAAGIENVATATTPTDISDVMLF